MSSIESPAVVVFDGTCVLCSGWTAYLLRNDHRHQFRFATTQSSAGRMLLLAHGISAENPSTFLLLHAGRAYVASDAVIHMFRLIGGAWRAAVLAGAVPRSFRDAIYGFVARHRYRWFGRRSVCYAPTASDRDRFLE